MIEAPHTFRESVLTVDDARLLRRYKKLLQAHVLKEKLFCAKCAERGDPDGCRASVMDGQIEIVCRCTRRTFTGQSY